MSLKLLHSLTCISVVFSHPVFAFTAANDNVKSGDAAPSTPTSDAAGQDEKPVLAGQDGGGGGGQAVTALGDECTRRSENSAKTCNNYLNPPQRREASQVNEPPGSATRTIGQINRSIEGGVFLFQARYRSCIFSTEVCVQSCASKPEQINKCKGLKTAAEKRNDENQRLAKEARDKNDALSNGLAGQKPTDGAGNPAIPNLPTGSGGVREASPPSLSTANRFHTQSTSPMAAPAQALKTPEQAKQERREKRREENRQERIDALGKAFMNLNPQQQQLGQALQERSYGQSEQRTQTAAAKAAAAAGPSAAEAPEEDEEEIGRAGFNKLAEKNLAARKKLAAAMGVNATNLSAAALTRPQSATGGGGGGFGGSVFGGTNSFSHSGDGASLDPVVKVEPPSDLPQNFRLETPSAGGGGRGPSRRMFGSMFTNDRDPHLSPRARSPAGLEDTEQPQEIRRRNADIWNVISVSFRRHCALGRLMDCADHLPK